ncbi:Two-component response regulator [Leptospira interrogans serovar Manilae]|uniref:diguanylate cyclase n=1 Tax=Leptospira interrogans serovar Manilae TaxID=214675 RepID=A0AAQ1NUN0_LEPIR|nr:GGDEF domain-containing protein [Leptospira interrogans]AKP25598.1 diguanylate cyclase [Leptospira interrogans serovar Manilae]AKP29382.1 diguanylate cyclase [Leptospira interrogans serovar Manilae]EYU61859.1 diguanylate cyclase [Leptospira interrogans serovar Manilae]SOR60377.1 Two-component response regulator [Leptospira interrogans serovar Manilae]
MRLSSGNNQKIKLLARRVFFNPFPDDYLRIYQPDVRRATVIYFFFCIGISFLSFLLPDGASLLGKENQILVYSRLTVLLLSAFFAFLLIKWRPFFRRRIERYSILSSGVIVFSILPYVFLDPGRMGLYFHFYTTLVVSGNILLWLTGTTVVIFNGLFYFSLVLCTSLTGNKNVLQHDFANVLIYLFTGIFGNLLINFWRVMDHRAKKKLQKAVSKLRDKNIQIEKISKVDELTGLYNRRYLIEQFELFLKRAQRYRFSLAMIILDMDYLKEINDSYGHLAGDLSLRTISDVMKQRVRATDICSRIGGDEFCILLDAIKKEDLVQLCENLRMEVAEKELSYRTQKGSPVKITVSIGACIFGPGEEFSFDDIYHSIDSALYESKKKGRNRVSFIEPIRYFPREYPGTTAAS